MASLPFVSISLHEVLIYMYNNLSLYVVLFIFCILTNVRAQVTFRELNEVYHRIGNTTDKENEVLPSNR